MRLKEAQAKIDALIAAREAWKQQIYADQIDKQQKEAADEAEKAADAVDSVGPVQTPEYLAMMKCRNYCLNTFAFEIRRASSDAADDCLADCADGEWVPPERTFDRTTREPYVYVSPIQCGCPGRDPYCGNPPCDTASMYVAPPYVAPPYVAPYYDGASVVRCGCPGRDPDCGNPPCNTNTYVATTASTYVAPYTYVAPPYVRQSFDWLNNRGGRGRRGGGGMNR